MKIGAIIQARTSSTRLPKKVLKPLPANSDVCVLQQVIRRVAKSKLIDEIIVATTTHSEDEEIVEVAKKENVKYYQGSLENVLERYYMAALENNLDVIVRITSDNPCIDYQLIDDVIYSHLNFNADYTSTALVEHFPIGIGVELINFDVLENVYNNATKNYEKEHVTPYIYKSHPDDFNINVFKGVGINYSNIRLTLDTPQDYVLLAIVYDYLYQDNIYFDLNDILSLFDNKPFLKDINSKITQKRVYNNLDDELQELIKLCDKQELYRAKDFIINIKG